MNTWQEGRPGGGGNGYGGSPGGFGSEGEPNPYRAQAAGGQGAFGQGGGQGGERPYRDEPTLPAGLNPRGPNAPKPLKPGQSAPAPQPVPRQPDRGQLPASLNPRGPGAPVPAYTPPAPATPPAPHGNPAGGAPGAPIPPGTPGGPGAPRPPRPSNPAWPRKRKIKVGVYAALAAILVTATGTYFWADSKLNHENVLADYKGRPPAGKGTNWLIVGSDSRQGLSDAQEDALHTGSAVGKRSDSMMLLHIGDNGNTLTSIPRDSWVTIPEHPNSNGNGKIVPATTSKINAAFNGGGGRLLVQTVEFNTGLRIDHYAEIGFAGFVGLVDAVGGVEMKIDNDIKDRDSGLDLKAGTQTLTGSQALAFVRQRHQMADQDLGRMRNQQKFLAALAHQAASPGTVLNPFTFYPMVSAGLGTLIVDEDSGLGDVGSLFLAMRAVTGGDGKSMTVPISNPDFRTNTGESAVKWDAAKSKQLFEAFKNDAKVPDFK